MSIVKGVSERSKLKIRDEKSGRKMVDFYLPLEIEELVQRLL